MDYKAVLSCCPGLLPSSDGGGAEGPGPAEVRPGLAGPPPLSDHEAAGHQRPAVLPRAEPQEED